MENKREMDQWSEAALGEPGREARNGIGCDAGENEGVVSVMAELRSQTGSGVGVGRVE